MRYRLGRSVAAVPTYISDGCTCLYHNIQVLEAERQAVLNEHKDITSAAAADALHTKLDAVLRRVKSAWLGALRLRV